MVKKKIINRKGETMDKEVKKIVLYYYMNDPLYPIYYREISNFFNPVNGIQEESFSHHSVRYDDDGNMIGAEGPAKNFDDQLSHSMTFSKEEYEIQYHLFDRKIKAVDVTKNFKISNVTIKARLKRFFILRRFKEGKIGYLGLMLTYQGMIGVAMYNFFKSKEGKSQSEIIDFFSFLQEKK